jgi:RNA polymerase sigma-70 factor (ECF subfamily)
VSGVDPLTRLAYQAQAGDRRALEVFVETSYDQVWRLCAALVDGQSADDLAQETFAQAVRSLPRFRRESSARTWLLSIARHVCLDELRGRVRQRSHHAPLDPSVGPVVSDVGGEVEAADLIGRLGPERREAFVLTQVLGLSYREAAEVCECPIGTVRSRVARARADLVEFLHQQAPGDLRSSSA